MTPETLLIFTTALFILFISPGGGKALVVARTLADGPLAGSVFWGGIISADVIWFSVVIGGLTVAADQASGTVSGLIVAAKVLGGLYLLWLAGQAFHKGWSGAVMKRPDVGSRGMMLAGTFAGGFLLSISSPKPIAFYVGLMPSILIVEQVTGDQYAVLLGILLVLAVMCGGVYIVAAHKARDWMVQPAVRRVTEYVTGALFLALAGMVFWSFV